MYRLLEFLKRFKRRLRWKRRWLIIGTILSLIPAALLWGASWYNHMEREIPTSTLVSQLEVKDSECIFTKTMDEATEECKENTYFGISDKGNLSLFEGPPSEKKVIRSFYQLDVEYLESSLPREMVNQLYEGIHVTDFAEYNSVLSTFSDYAIEISEEAMKSMLE